MYLSKQLQTARQIGKSLLDCRVSLYLYPRLCASIWSNTEYKSKCDFRASFLSESARLPFVSNRLALQRTHHVHICSYGIYLEVFERLKNFDVATAAKCISNVSKQTKPRYTSYSPHLSNIDLVWFSAWLGNLFTLWLMRRPNADTDTEAI